MKKDSGFKHTYAVKSAIYTEGNLTRNHYTATYNSFITTIHRAW